MKRKPDIFDELGYDKTKCPVCGTRTRKGICLNGCGLRAMQRVVAALKAALDPPKVEEKKL